MKSVQIRLYLAQDTRSRAGVEEILAALASRGLSPDHASHDEFCRTPFSPEELIGVALRQTFDGLGYFLARRAPPAWTGYLSFATEKLSFLEVHLTTGDLESTRAGFEHASALARALRPVVGHAFAKVGVLPYDNLDVNVQPDRYGLSQLYARTFFGAGIAARVGEPLGALAAAVRPYPGGIEVDLVPAPWSAPWEEIQAAAETATYALRDTGLFGDYEARPRPKAPAGWSGLPREV